MLIAMLAAYLTWHLRRTTSVKVRGVQGFGRGGGFGLGLTLLVAYAPDPAASSRLSAMAFLVAYSFAALGPVLLGGLRDLTGSFALPFLVLLAIDIAQLGVVARLQPSLRVG